MPSLENGGENSQITSLSVVPRLFTLFTFVATRVGTFLLENSREAPSSGVAFNVHYQCLKRCAQSIVEDGTMTQFWHDNWFEVRTLKNLCPEKFANYTTPMGTIRDIIASFSPVDFYNDPFLQIIL